MDLATMVNNIELDLNDSANGKLAAANYQSHVAQAVKDFSIVYPRRLNSLLSIQKECHKVSDTTNVITSADAVDLATSITYLNELKADYNLHIASTTYHRAADATNAASSTDASSLATCLTLANELKADLNAHHILDGVHYVNDTANTVTAQDAVDLTTLLVLCADLNGMYATHLTAETDGRSLYVYSVVSATGYLRIENIEYPIDRFPPAYPAFELDGNWAKILTNYAPGTTGELVRIHYQVIHTLNGSASTIPNEYESTIRVGGAGYACLEIYALRMDAANAVWTSQAHHLTTEDATVGESAQDYLEAGDAYINTINDGANVAGQYNEYARTELAISHQWADKRKDLIREAESWKNLGNEKIGLFRAELDKIRQLRICQEKPSSMFYQVFAD